MTWYACGKVLPAAAFGDDLQSSMLDYIKESAPNLFPTTYEAADAYLREELKKPKGKRDLLREMCAMIPLDLPKDRKVSFIAPSMGIVFPLKDGEYQYSAFKGSSTQKLIHSCLGSTIISPTTDLPPDSFGTPGNVGILDSDRLIYDPPTQTPQQGIILLSYFTKLGPDAPVAQDGSVNRIQLDTSPFA